MKTFSECINSYLIDKRLSQSAAAKQFGIHQTMVGEYMNQGKIPRADTFIRIAKVIGVDPLKVCFQQDAESPTDPVTA